MTGASRASTNSATLAYPRLSGVPRLLIGRRSPFGSHDSNVNLRTVVRCSKQLSYSRVSFSWPGAPTAFPAYPHAVPARRLDTLSMVSVRKRRNKGERRFIDVRSAQSISSVLADTACKSALASMGALPTVRFPSHPWMFALAMGQSRHAAASRIRLSNKSPSLRGVAPSVAKPFVTGRP